MKYISTRSENYSVSAAQAIVSGLALDGGLFIPESLPQFTIEQISDLSRLDYVQLATVVLSRFLSDFTQEQLHEAISKAYAPKKFPIKQIAPIISLKKDTYLLELFHGPTCAFKDFALQLLPQLLTLSLKKTKEERTAVILAATSGDTGKAALEGFADVPKTRICVFYPQGGTSNMQRRQMITQAGKNVMVFATKGNFDDAQNGVKRLFTDQEFAAKLSEKGFFLSSANSINWGRLVAQITYYFSAYCQLLCAGKIQLGESINVAVPTGNFGNLLAAYFAKHCGLPIKKLICASNQNNILTDFITTGTYDCNRPFYLTTSPSMDILISSNLERLLYLLCNRDTARLHAYMQALAVDGKYTIDAAVLESLQNEFAAGYADDRQTAQTIRTVFAKTGYLCDTHTAVAVKVYEEYHDKTKDQTPVIIVSTASPFKFAESVLSALQIKPQGDDFELLQQLAQISGKKIPDALMQLRERTERFTTAIDPMQMKQEVLDWLNQGLSEKSEC